MDVAARIHDLFPEARSGLALTRRTERILREEGLRPDTTVLATSTCPDELNRNVTGFDRRWGPAFHLGGLAGLPFTGRTGVDAYLAHLPDEGAGLVIYASHVGLTDEGTWGRIRRSGQEHTTTCCGSAMGAWEVLEASGGADDFEDGQQQTVTAILEGHRDRLVEAEHPGAAAADVLAEAIEREIRTLFPPRPAHTAVMLGGVQINTPGHEEDYFAPRTFAVRRPGEDEPISLREELLA